MASSKNKNINEEEIKAPAEEAVDTAEAAEAVADEEITLPKSKLEALENELNEVKDARLRLAAEYDNFRKRTARERETLFTDAKVLTVAEFLSVFDNLERAIATPTEDTAYAKGVEMIFTQFNEVMQKLKVEEINPQGEKFDPNLHNAVMHVEDEAFEESTVAEVFQKGFKIGDKVVRHAMVKVAN